MTTQLDPPLPLDTPAGPAYAHALVDRGGDGGIAFVCFLLATGACVVVPAADVRLQRNVTMGVRAGPDPAGGPG